MAGTIVTIHSSDSESEQSDAALRRGLRLAFGRVTDVPEDNQTCCPSQPSSGPLPLRPSSHRSGSGRVSAVLEPAATSARFDFSLLEPSLLGLLKSPAPVQVTLPFTPVQAPLTSVTSGLLGI